MKFFNVEMSDFTAQQHWTTVYRRAVDISREEGNAEAFQENMTELGFACARRYKATGTWAKECNF